MMQLLRNVVVLLSLVSLTVASYIPSYAGDPTNTSVVYSGVAGFPIMVMDPNIMRDSAGWHLFYSTYFCLKPDGDYYYSWNPQDDAACSINGYITAIGYAFSTDNGFSWSYRGPPVFQPGGEEWEQYKVETAFVYNKDETLYMFYCALGYVNGTLLDGRYQVGVSSLFLGSNQTVSELLLNTTTQFNRSHPSPVIPYNLVNSSFTNNVQEPSALYRNGRWEVFFLGLQYSEPSEDVYASGQVLQLLGAGRAMLDDDLNILQISSSPLPNTTMVNMPEVRVDEDAADEYRYVMASGGFGVSGGYVHEGEFVQESYSSNGINWSLPTAIYVPPLNGSEAFNGWGASSPTLVLAGGGLSNSTVYYSAYGADFTTNNGVCDYAVRYGIGVPTPPGCVYITLGRMVSEDSTVVAQNDPGDGDALVDAVYFIVVLCLAAPVFLYVFAYLIHRLSPPDDNDNVSVAPSAHANANPLHPVDSSPTPIVGDIELQ